MTTEMQSIDLEPGATARPAGLMATALRRLRRDPVSIFAFSLWKFPRMCATYPAVTPSSTMARKSPVTTPERIRPIRQNLWCNSENHRRTAEEYILLIRGSSK